MKKIIFLLISILSATFHIAQCQEIDAQCYQENPIPVTTSTFSGLEGHNHIYYIIGRVTIAVVPDSDEYKILIWPDSKKAPTEYKAGKLQILDWAFQELPDELKRTTYTVEDIYDPIYYELAYVNERNEKEVVSSSKKTATSDKFNEHLQELKEYLVTFWSDNCIIKKNKDTPPKNWT